MSENIETPDYETVSHMEPWLASIMHGLGVTSIEASFSGGGDEGQMDDLIIYTSENSEKTADEIESYLEGLKVRQAAHYQPSFFDKLKEMLENDVEPVGDYANGDGGSAWLRIAITEDGAFVESSYFTPYEPEDEEYDEDEEWQP